jgi:hypothetical protein
MYACAHDCRARNFHSNEGRTDWLKHIQTNARFSIHEGGMSLPEIQRSRIRLVSSDETPPVPLPVNNSAQLTVLRAIMMVAGIRAGWTVCSWA